MKVLLTFLFSLFFFVGISHALPVALQNHLSFSSSNSRRMNELLLNYSPSLYYGVGLTYLRLNHSEYFIPRLDFLLYRATNFQFFTSLGAGIENVNGSQFNARIAELVTVFSTPEFYDFFEHMYLLRDSRRYGTPAYNHSKLKLGYAPYAAAPGELVTYILFQLEKYNDEDFTAAQFLRFSFRNASWELGADFEGQLQFNLNLGI